MSPQDFDLSVSHLARSSCHSKMVLQQFSCSAILPHHSQHLVCICSNISQNVEGLRSIPISLHIQTAISHQCRNSLSMSSFQFFNSLKTLSVIWYAVYMSWLHICSFVTNGLIRSSALKTTENDKMCSNDRVAVKTLVLL